MLKVIPGDITQINADAIVNAANSSLMGGSGVDGAIHKKGGKSISDECIEIRHKQGACKVGEAVITRAGNLPSNFVIHAVGPFWQDGNNNEDELLSNAYKNSLKIAIENNVQTIAFPNISTGVFGFPKQRAASIALSTVLNYMKQPNTINEVIFVCFDDENYDIYNAMLDKLSASYNVKRFIEGQAFKYQDAFNEISNGKKTSHWIWYIFPQLSGLGRSGLSQKYAIRDLFEVELYLSHEILGKRLLDICKALLKIGGKSIQEIFGSSDYLKLQSCMTLFGLSKNANPIFEQILDKFFDGNKCSKTLELLNANIP